jgi:GT2 family glycosyltransferase
LISQISIVTPSYNQRPFIELALESVRSQNYASVEHVVVDGGSTDGTVEYLRSLSGKTGWQHLRWISEPDRGQSDALNKGFRMASGDIVGWLNSDDVYRSGCFAAITSAFENNRAVDILYGDTTWIDEKSNIIQVRREIEFSRFVLAAFLTTAIGSIPATTTLWTTSSFCGSQMPVTASSTSHVCWRIFVGIPKASPAARARSTLRSTTILLECILRCSGGCRAEFHWH